MKLLGVTLVAVITALSGTHVADAATYDVRACDAAAGAVNNSWSFETNDSAHIDAVASCPSDGIDSGLFARDRLRTAGAAAGSYGQWILRSSAGTRITHIRASRRIGVKGGTGWRPFGRGADGVTLVGETCTVQPGQDECNLAGTIDRALSTTSIAYGFECPSPGLQCITGATIHAARAAIYSAIVTIDDPTPPVIDSPTGELVRASGFHKGVESVTFNGRDALGLKARRLYVDGVEVAADAPACDYTYVVPCSNPGAPVTLEADLDGLADGPHTVEAGVVDAAGNETRSDRATIVVDHTAPSAPQGLHTSARAAAEPRFRATWAYPGEQTAPIRASHWRVCPEGASRGCSAGTTSEPSLGGTLPAYGRYTLFVALEDAAGNRGAEAAIPLIYEAPETPAPGTPTPTPTPTATPAPPVAQRADARLKIRSATFRRSSRTVTTLGTATVAATGTLRVKVTYRAGGKARSRTVNARLREGRFTARIRLSRSDARRARRLLVTVRYAGDAGHRGASTRRTAKTDR